MEQFKPGFHMIVTIFAMAENGSDDPDDHLETPIFFSVTIVTIRIATVVEIETIVRTLREDQPLRIV